MKKQMTKRDLINKIQENSVRMREISDTMQKEQRDYTESEKVEYNTLLRESHQCQIELSAMAADLYRGKEHGFKASAKLIRDNMHAGRQTVIMLQRDLVMVADAESGAIVPLKVQDIIEPLEEGLILNKVGLPLMSGLAGDYVWPTYEAVDATIAGEGVALSDTEIELSKLTAQPQRIGIAIPITREAIDQTEGLIEDIAKKVMPQAIARLINKVLFSTEKVANATTLVGPFVDSPNSFSFSAEPTFKEYCQAKAKVLATGIDGENLCWVMTKAQKAIAESTPKDKGSGMMICENDRIAGLPVYTTNFIGEGKIGLGDWRYQPMGLFGDMHFVVDPYSQSRKNAVDFVLNANYGTTTLRKEAFLLGTVGA